MGVRHRLPPKAAGDRDAPRVHASDAPDIQASDALPLPIRHTNKIFSVLFMAALYFLMCRWREKVRASTPLHLLTLSEILAFVCLVASLIYLISFFGISYVQSSILSHDDIDEKVDVVERSQPSLPRHRFRPTPAVSTPPPSPCPLLAEISDAKFPSVCPNDEDEKVVRSVLAGETPSYILESMLGDCRRAAGARREAMRRITGRAMEGLPLDGFDYQSILGQCCEMPVGFVTLPVGIAGPLVLDGLSYYLPMATTEGCLVASTNRGCKAIALSGGAQSVVLRDAMSRAPVVRFVTARRAAHLKVFLEDPTNFDALATVFNRSSRFARLQGIHCSLAGRNVYMRFSCSTGDAMGMNMVSKGVQNVLDYLQADFPDIDIISISGNFCSDKKPAAVNWIEGRGKSVVCEATIKEEVALKVLKTTVPALVELNVLKNLAGSAVAGALGGFNAHASNIVTAIYIATGQDPAQNVESSHCVTMMEAVNGGKDLHISVTMPSIEVGTVGGGTQLAAQAACLDLLGVKGPSLESPGANSRRLATIIAGAVLAGELSLMSALASGQLVNSHMKYNRSSRDIPKAAAA
ncbi:putative hydroxymethylglutaryl-CoA reductase (NADPH) [Dioscorea sansibarensis]